MLTKPRRNRFSNSVGEGSQLVSEPLYIKSGGHSILTSTEQHRGLGLNCPGKVHAGVPTPHPHSRRPVLANFRMPDLAGVTVTTNVDT